MRIGDAERAQTGAVLGQHLAAGRLTMSEFENRLDTVYAAATRGELDVVLVDLPAAAPTPPRTQAPEAPAQTCSMWGSWALTSAVCLLIWVATSLAQGRPLEFWPVWVIGPWGVVVGSRVIVARVGRLRHA